MLLDSYRLDTVSVCTECDKSDANLMFAIKVPGNGAISVIPLEGIYCSENCALIARTAEICAFASEVKAGEMLIRVLGMRSRSAKARAREKERRDYMSPEAREARSKERLRLRNEADDAARAAALEGREEREAARVAHNAALYEEARRNGTLPPLPPPPTLPTVQLDQPRLEAGPASSETLHKPLPGPRYALPEFLRQPGQPGQPAREEDEEDENPA